MPADFGSVFQKKNYGFAPQLWESQLKTEALHASTDCTASVVETYSAKYFCWTQSKFCLRYRRKLTGSEDFLFSSFSSEKLQTTLGAVHIAVQNCLFKHPVSFVFPPLCLTKKYFVSTCPWWISHGHHLQWQGFLHVYFYFLFKIFLRAQKSDI